MKNHATTLWVMLSMVSGVTAQDQLQHSVNTDSIRIGEQINYTIQIPKSIATERVLPLQDTLGTFTVVSSQIDDNSSTDIILMQNVLTVFDSGTWQIQSYSLADQNTSVIDIYCNTVPVDTAKPFRPIYGIREVEDVSIFSWWWLVLVLLLIESAIIWYYIIYRNRHKTKDSSEVETTYTPYEKALAQLEEIQKKKEWQDESQVKEYYTHITDVMREYIQEQYDVHAMESTSSELMNRIRRVTKINQRRQDIAWILERADLAKFAKTRPTVEENIEALKKVQFIIKWLKPKKIETED